MAKGEKKMNKAIKKIELDLGGKVVSLTPEQAKNLKDALDDLFGKEIVRVKEYISFPVPLPTYPSRPYYWEWQRPWPVTCDSTERYLCNDITGNYTADSGTLRLTG